jgi:hypothetical protein
MAVSVPGHAPSALSKERTPLSIELAAEWTPRTVWTSLEMIKAPVSTGIRIQVYTASRRSLYIDCPTQTSSLTKRLTNFRQETGGPHLQVTKIFKDLYLPAWTEPSFAQHNRLSVRFAL